MPLAKIHFKIKEISEGSKAQKSMIFTYRIAKALNMGRDEIVPDLINLEKLGIIKFNDINYLAFSLTDYGKVVELP